MGGIFDVVEFLICGLDQPENAFQSKCAVQLVGLGEPVLGILKDRLASNDLSAEQRARLPGCVLLIENGVMKSPATCSVITELVFKSFKFNNQELTAAAELVAKQLPDTAKMRVILAAIGAYHEPEYCIRLLQLAHRILEHSPETMDLLILSRHENRLVGREAYELLQKFGQEHIKRFSFDKFEEMHRQLSS